MRSFRGWFGERYRHSLAARGISLAAYQPPLKGARPGDVGYFYNPQEFKKLASQIAFRKQLGRQHDIAELRAITPEPSVLEKSMPIFPEEFGLDSEKYPSLKTRELEIQAENADIKRANRIASLLLGAKENKVDEMMKLGIITQDDLEFWKTHQYLVSSDIMNYPYPMYTNIPGLEPISEGEEDRLRYNLQMMGEYADEGKYGEKYLQSVPNIIGPSLEEGRENIMLPSRELQPLYGTAEHPFVPYWYGKSQSMTSGESLNMYRALLDVRQKVELKKLIADNPILMSNKLSGVERSNFMKSLESQAKQRAINQLSDELGFESMPNTANIPGGIAAPYIFSKEDMSNIYAQEYPEMKKLAAQRQLHPYSGQYYGTPYTWFDLSPSSTPSFEKKPISGTIKVDHLNPFTGKVEHYGYTQVLPQFDKKDRVINFPTSEMKTIDTNIQNKVEKWNLYIKYLQGSGIDIPNKIRNVNQLRDWYEEKRPDVPYENLDRAIKQSIISFRARLKQGSEKKPGRVVPTISKLPAEDTQRRIREVYAGGTYFNSEQAAAAFVNRMKGSSSEPYNMVKEGNQYRVFAEVQLK
jgi:hypothetical protein